MRSFLVIFVSFLSVVASASAYRARFELNSDIYKEGVRFVEFKTDKVDVAYKVLSADEDHVILNVYFTNVSKRTITVDRSLFSLTSLESREAFSGTDPDDIDGADASDFFPRAVLKPDDSAGGQIVFSVKEAEGRWALKNKLTLHSYTLAVKKNLFGSD